MYSLKKFACDLSAVLLIDFQTALVSVKTAACDHNAHSGFTDACQTGNRTGGNQP